MALHAARLVGAGTKLGMILPFVMEHQFLHNIFRIDLHPSAQVTARFKFMHLLPVATGAGFGADQRRDKNISALNPGAILSGRWIVGRTGVTIDAAHAQMAMTALLPVVHQLRSLLLVAFQTGLGLIRQRLVHLQLFDIRLREGRRNQSRQHTPHQPFHFHVVISPHLR